MSSYDRSSLGRQLAIARRNQTLLAAEPFKSIASLSEAYHVQQRALDLYGSLQIGYKVGATNPVVQKMFGCDSPFYGPLFDTEHLSPGVVLPMSPGLLGGEAEFAFRCSSDFPDDTDLKIEDLPALISECRIAVEIVGSRLQGDGLPDFQSAIADFGANVAFISGETIDNWPQKDLSAIEVSASVDGEQTNSGTGAAVLGNPLNALLWLHNALRTNGQRLNTGDWISTGTCLGVIAAKAGSRVDVKFREYGNLNYQIA